MSNIQKSNNIFSLFLENSLFYDIDKSWYDFFRKELREDYFLKIIHLINEMIKMNIYFSPSIDLIFNLFKVYKFNKDTKVIILGESPYKNNNIANGIAFATNNFNQTPLSLKNIKKEILNSYPDLNLAGNDLHNWLSQGVIPINIYWTYETNALVYKKINKLWKKFTINFVKYLKNKETLLVFFGNASFIVRKNILIDDDYVMKVAHPSPLSCYKGFINSEIFSKINNKLSISINWKT